jgi:hypothetical protein
VHPISSSLQVYFAYLLATHLDITTDSDLTSALHQLDNRFRSVYISPPSSITPGSYPQFKLEEVDLHFIPPASQKPVAAHFTYIPGKTALRPELFALIEELARLFEPMGPDARAVLGSFYSRAFETLFKSHLRSDQLVTVVSSSGEQHSALIKPGFLSLKDNLQQFAAQLLGYESSEIDDNLRIIHETFREVEGRFFLRSRSEGGGSGSGSNKRDPSSESKPPL